MKEVITFLKSINGGNNKMDRIKDVGKAKKFGKTLREQNQARRCIDSKSLKGLESFFCRVDKFTIVELLFNGKRYHGLTAKSDQDITNVTEGVALAYKRAFDEMVEDQGLIDNPGTRSNTFEGTIAAAVAGMSRQGCSIDIGVITSGTHSIKCFKCGHVGQYSVNLITSETRCSGCSEKLISASPL